MDVASVQEQSAAHARVGGRAGHRVDDSTGHFVNAAYSAKNISPSSSSRIQETKTAPQPAYHRSTQTRVALQVGEALLSPVNAYGSQRDLRARLCRLADDTRPNRRASSCPVE